MLAQIEDRLDGPLAIERTRYGDDVLVLAFSGELDLAVIPAAREFLAPAFEEPTTIMVVIDLTELEFICAGGIGLLYALGRARVAKDSLRLLPSRHRGVNKVLELTDVGSVVPVVTR
jgi:anti-anti-sigma factor